MADNIQVRDAAGATQTMRTTDSGTEHTPHHYAHLRVGGSDVAGGNPVPVDMAGVATAAAQTTGNASLSAIDTSLNAVEASTASIDAKLPSLASAVPDNLSTALPVRVVGQDIWNCSFSDVGASVLSSDFTLLRQGTGVTYSQTAGSLAVVTGTTANAEFLAQSTVAWRGALRAKVSSVLSQRIVNTNFMWVLADLIGTGLAVTVNSAVSISVTKTAHGLTATSVGQFMFVGAISGVNGVPGRYAIASIPDVNTINFTVAGWPASGSGTLTLFGHSHAKVLYTGTTATASAVTTQRRGWADADTTLAINTTASPGHIHHLELTGRECFWSDQLRASTTTPAVVVRGSRVETVPDDNLSLYLFLWSYNGSTAPASTTTWTVGFASVEKFANTPVYIQGARAQGGANPLPVTQVGTITATATLAAATVRAGFMAGAGIWYDDSSTVLAAGATFTGTSRDLTVTATATAFANAGTYAEELRVSAESDQTGTLWLEVSRDNTNWRRVKSVATTAVSGGGFYAEIVHAPSWRYARVGYTNGATLQGRFTIGSITVAL